MTTVPPAPQPATTPPPGAAKPDYTSAWLPHLLMVLTWWLGPLIYWLVKKDTDKVAAFHSKQAFFWGLLVTVVWIVGIILGFIVGAILAAITAGIGACVFPCIMVLILVGNLVYGIMAIMAASQGKPFKYFFVAKTFCKNEFAAAYPGAA